MAGPGVQGRPRVHERWQLAEHHQKVWALWREGGIKSYTRIAEITGYSERTVRRVIKACLSQLVLGGDAREEAAKLWAETEELKQRIEASLFVEVGTVPVAPDKDDVNSWIKLVRVQMDILGIKSPTVILHGRATEESEETVAYVDRLRRAMDVADRIASEGYGSGRDTVDKGLTERLLQGDVLEADLVSEPAPPSDRAPRQP